MEARDHPNSPAQIFAWRKEVRARLIADRLSIDPADRRQYAGKIALHLSRFIEPLSKRTVSFYWPFRGEPDLRPLMQTVVEGGGRCALPVIVEKKAPLVFRLWKPGERLAAGIWNIPIPSDGRRVARPCGRAGSRFRQRWLSAWIWGWLLRSYTSDLAPSPPRHRRRI